MAPWPRAPVIPQLVDCKNFRDNRWVRHLSLTSWVNFHAGQELVLSLIRQKFWIPHGKSAVKKELRNCIDCFKLVAKPVSQMMGDLPIERFNPCRTFEKSVPCLNSLITSLTNQSLSIHSRWSLLMKLKRMLWSRWQLSYLHTLQSRTKWVQGQKDLTVGSLVLIKNPASFSTRWTPGRIVVTHPGADGICRVVTNQTSSGVMTRPVSQVTVLPLPPSTTSSRPPEDIKNS
ncbi:integrase catalytic domain-containing protein [Trichonephila clavipes]|nr:integrase catalytic domain-containing protein [Trichonephila clavipes]